MQTLERTIAPQSLSSSTELSIADSIEPIMSGALKRGLRKRDELNAEYLAAWTSEKPVDALCKRRMTEGEK